MANPADVGQTATPGAWAAGVAIAVLLLDVGVRVWAVGYLPRNRKPSTGTAWLLAVLAVPTLGLLVFVIFGGTRVGRARVRRQEEVNERIAQRTRAVVDDLAGVEDAPAYLASVVWMNRGLGTLPLVGGNDVLPLPGYGDSVSRMAEAVRAARSSVDVEFYITAWDEVTAPLFDAMSAAAGRGVTVRLLFDHLGSRGIPGYREMVGKLSATGIDWHAMLPIQPLRGKLRRPDLRNHRKLLVVDGRVGFTGSQNLTEPGYNKPKNHRLGREWNELMLRLEGPVVTELAAVFASDWYAETGDLHPVQPATTATGAEGVAGVACQLVPSGPGYRFENNLRLFNALLYGATHRVSLTSPYFVPDESLLYAVTTAAHRGVAVELFVSEVSDQFMVGHAQASYYQALLESGVRIYLYPAPGVLHAKHLSVDDDVAVVGTSNMDMRSFSLNYEMSLMLVGRPVVSELRTVEDSYRAMSRELTLEEWSRRPARLQYVDTVMRLTSALQ